MNKMNNSESEMNSSESEMNNSESKMNNSESEIFQAASASIISKSIQEAASASIISKPIQEAASVLIIPKLQYHFKHLQAFQFNQSINQSINHWDDGLREHGRMPPVLASK